MDTEKQRQRIRDDARLTESGNARSEQLNTRGAYRVASQQRMAARRALEWIGASKARLLFRYEILGLFWTKSHTIKHSNIQSCLEALSQEAFPVVRW